MKKLMVAIASAVALTCSAFADATSWFNGGVELGWPDSAVGGAWSNTVDQTSYASSTLTIEADAETPVAFNATDAKTIGGDAKTVTISSTIKFTPFETLPDVPADAKAGVIAVKDGGDWKFYALAKDGDVNVWTDTGIETDTASAEVSPFVVKVTIAADGEATYDIDGDEFETTIVTVGTISSANYLGDGEIRSLTATYEQNIVNFTLPEVAGATITSVTIDGEPVESPYVGKPDAALVVTYTADAGKLFANKTDTYVYNGVVAAGEIPTGIADQGLKDAPAKVLEKLYYTLADAFEEVCEGQTLTLLTAVDESIVYEGIETFTLNMNGKAWTVTGDAIALKVDNEDANITITGNGSITVAKGFCVWTRQGEVTIENGTFTNDDNDNYAIYAGGGVAPNFLASKVTIKDGTFVNLNAEPYKYNPSLSKLNLNVQNGNELAVIEVSGGTFTAEPKDDSGISFLKAGYASYKQGDVWTVAAAMPKATVAENPIAAAYGALDAAYTFAVDGVCPAKPVADKNVDYVVTFDNDVEAGAIRLAAVMESGWTNFPAMKFTKNTPYPLIASMQKTVSVAEMYAMGTFTCGISNINVTTETKMTVQLVMADTVPYVITNVTYTITPKAVSSMFYIGDTGYDSWAEAIAAAAEGGTIKVGDAALIPADTTLSKSITIDLFGNKLTIGKYCSVDENLTVTDTSDATGSLDIQNELRVSAALDLGDLVYAQTTGCAGGFDIAEEGVVTFPADVTFPACKTAINSAEVGAKIVVAGTTYNKYMDDFGTHAVAMIDDTYEYATLEGALADAEDDDEVELLADITTDAAAPFVINADITLDFADYTVTKTVANPYTFDIPNGVTVEFKGDEGGVKQTASDLNPTSPASMIRNKGNLTISGGVYESDFCIIKNDEDPGAGVLTVVGGTFKMVRTAGGYTGRQMALMNWATAVISGGQWDDCTIGTRSCDGNAVSKAGTTTISGYIAGNPTYLLYVGSPGDTTYANVPKIKGDDISVETVTLGQVDSIKDQLMLTEDDDGYVTVAQVKAMVDGELYASFAEAYESLSEDDLTITLLADDTLSEAVANEYNATIYLNGKTLTVTGNKYFTVSADTEVSISGGTIALDTANAYGIQVYGELTVEDTMIYKVVPDQGNPVFDVYNGATLNIEDCADLNSGSQDVIRFKGEGNSSTVNILGGTFETTSTFLIVSGGAVMHLNISDGEITAKLNNFDVETGSTLDLELGRNCDAKFKIDNQLADYCAEGYAPVKEGDWYVIKEKSEPEPVVPGEPIPVPQGKTQEEFMDDINTNAAVKAQYLKAPDGAETTGLYLDCFNAVPAGDSSQVTFLVNETGTNAVEAATTVAETATLAAVFDSDSSAVSIASPLVGFYYSFKQGDDLENLDYNVVGDHNQLATGSAAISFTLVKPEGQGFYKTVITAVPYEAE